MFFTVGQKYDDHHHHHHHHHVTAATIGPNCIPQVIYEHGESWWKDVDIEKSLIRPPDISGNPTS
jgi:hypothetical protein